MPSDPNEPKRDRREGNQPPVERTAPTNYLAEVASDLTPSDELNVHQMQEALVYVEYVVHGAVEAARRTGYAKGSVYNIRLRVQAHPPSLAYAKELLRDFHDRVIYSEAESQTKMRLAEQAALARAIELLPSTDPESLPPLLTAIAAFRRAPGSGAVAQRPTLDADRDALGDDQVPVLKIGISTELAKPRRDE